MGGILAVGLLGHQILTVSSQGKSPTMGPNLIRLESLLRAYGAMKAGQHLESGTEQ